MSHDIAGQWYRHSERKREKETTYYIHDPYNIIRNTFSIALLHTERAERVCSHTCKLPIIYSDIDTLTERKRERETNADQETYLYTYNQCQYSLTWLETFREKEWETLIKRRTLTPSVSDNIVGHCYTHSERKRYKEIRIKRRTYTRRFTDNIHHTETERKKLGSRDLPV